MTATSQNIGTGQIFCIAQTFDQVLRALSPDYFAALHDGLSRAFHKIGISPRLEVGWMHPGYACVGLNADLAALDEPGGLFGWVSQSPETDLYQDRQRLAQLLEPLTAAQPPLHWATCSARLFRFKGAAPTDFSAMHDLLIEFALDDPTEWRVESQTPNSAPAEVWLQLCRAAATGDSDLEQRAWQDAREIYTPPAVALLTRGIEHARGGAG